MLERVPSGGVNFFAGRAIDRLVTLESNVAVEGRFQQLIAEGGVPFVYANHQGHADAMAVAIIAKHLRDLTLQPDGKYLVRGLAAILAKSMVSGHQSEELTSTYRLLVGACRQRGVVTIPVTREEDKIRYGMSRDGIASELRPLIRSLRDGYGIAFFPEGSVQGGRHPKGSSLEDIYGMHEPGNNNLIDFFQLMGRVTSRKPFFVPVGLNGSYRIMQSEEGGKPKLTPKGKWSLIAAALGIPIGVLSIKANLLMPFTEEEIIRDLGSDWLKDSTAFNRYAMRRLLPGIPTIAGGVYRESFDETVRPIEVSVAS